MLTGEYFVLDGAKALALPTKYGQHLAVKKYTGSDLVWKSLDKDKNVWFEAQISLFDFSAIKTTDEAKSDYLKKLLKNAVRLNSEFLSKWNGFRVETALEFPQTWGLGSSSSLTYLVAEWAGVNPFHLHFKNSNGSGYDVACTFADGPIFYKYTGDSLNYETCDFDPSFKSNLYFVYLGKKQSSEEAIKMYSKKVKSKKTYVEKISKITDRIYGVKSLKGFNDCLNEHEEIIASALGMKTVKELMFSDFWGSVKSLGAWGGDFVLATSDKNSSETKAYFASKGLDVCLAYDDIIL